MLKELIVAATKKHLKIAPFIGIGCPGVVEEDGSIDRGAQNLPGNWESSKFNLPSALYEMIPSIGEHETSIVLHNDAVVQGLSEIPFMQDISRWGVLTIGTALETRVLLTAKTRSVGSFLARIVLRTLKKLEHAAEHGRWPSRIV